MDTRTSIGGRIARFAAVAFLALFALAVRAVELTSGPEVETGTGRALIRWQTDVVAGARVQWGSSAGKLNRREQGPTGTNHQVELKELKAGTTYHFTVGTARVPLATNLFTMPVAGGLATNAPSPPPAGPGPGAVPGAGGVMASPVAQPQAPPSIVTWGAPRTLRDHFERHGRDFGATDLDDYAKRAWLFLQRARAEGLPAKRDSDGVLRVYDPATRTFGAYNRDRTTRTFFKPSRRDYFEDQPGRPVNLREER